MVVSMRMALPIRSKDQHAACHKIEEHRCYRSYGGANHEMQQRCVQVRDPCSVNPDIDARSKGGRHHIGNPALDRKPTAHPKRESLVERKRYRSGY